MTKVIQVIPPSQLTCGMGHTWESAGQVIDRGLVRREGQRRPRKQIDYSMQTPACPTCGHKWIRSEPIF